MSSDLYRTIATATVARPMSGKENRIGITSHDMIGCPRIMRPLAFAT